MDIACFIRSSSPETGSGGAKVVGVVVAIAVVEAMAEAMAEAPLTVAVSRQLQYHGLKYQK